MNPIEARIKQIEERLVGRNLKFLMDRLGGLLLGQAKTAFFRQRFGNNYPWAEKYPDQDEPFINVARAVDDFNSGASAPSSAAFVRYPALRDRGTLYASLFSKTVRRNVVEHGSSIARSLVHQHGGITSMGITDGAKERLKEWLKPNEDDPFADDGEIYADKMGWLIRPNNRTLDTAVNQRPFVGVTDETAPKLVRRVEAYFNA